MNRCAAIDIGTNSARLLVAEYSAGKLRPLELKLVTTRLGEGAGGGVLLKQAMTRTAEAVEKLYLAALNRGAGPVVVAATSAVRDALNRGEFLEMVRLKTGLPVNVLSGEEEALLSCRGALAGLNIDLNRTVVLDVGGGSTELIWRQGARLRFASVNAGAVRTFETGAGEEALADLFRPVLEDVLNSPVKTLVGVGGTVTALAAMDQALDPYDPDKVHGYGLDLADIANLLKTLKGMTVEERKRIPGLQPERADIIETGVVIVKIVMEGLGINRIIVSEWDILHGLLLEKIEIKK